jgi:endonuclease/exonuclease/phosphatase family metal-dependent hydrolase
VYVALVQLRVITWNLLHGRSMPSAGRELLGEFAAALAAWEWDLALLQEVPPWWPDLLAQTTGAQARRVLTSRNSLLAVRRFVAEQWPDVIKSNGGGANAILVRGHEVIEHRARRLCVVPERRWVQAVRLADDVWIGNLHATAHDHLAAVRDGRLAAATVLAWAKGASVVLGGDFNILAPTFDGLAWAGGHDVDHVFIAGLRVAPDGAARVLERGLLSDHAPVLVALEV